MTRTFHPGWYGSYTTFNPSRRDNDGGGKGRMRVALEVRITLDSEMRTTEYTEYTDFEWLLRKPSLTLGMNEAPSRDSAISVHSCFPWFPLSF